jgi:8-oxo-dGTP pyrophosphatase MutT (NUDIX family)
VKSVMKKQNDVHSAFVTAREHLQIGNAVAAIILLEDGRYLLQLRDNIESIWYPNHWGCFGGGVEPGEDPARALRRELREELSFDFTDTRFFTELEFDLAGLGLDRYYRKYYLVFMTFAEMDCLRLTEGVKFATFDAAAMLGTLELSPYDAFALFLHARSDRISGRSDLEGRDISHQQ